MQDLLGLLGLGGGGLLAGEAYNKLGDMGDTAMSSSRNIANEVTGMNPFTGYGVTSNLGSSAVQADGSTMFNMSQPQENYATKAHMLSSGFMDRAGQDPTGRENDIYAKIRAMQQPGEQRQQMELNNQLVNQGRAGVRSNMYGGTPEQFALSKAQAEAQNSAAYQAVDTARAQQQQDASLSSMFGGMQYLPQEQLRRDAAVGNQNYGYSDVNSRQNQTLTAEALMGGLDAKLASRLGQANLMGELGSSLITGGSGMFSNAIQTGATGGMDFLQSLWDKYKP